MASHVGLLRLAFVKLHRSVLSWHRLCSSSFRLAEQDHEVHCWIAGIRVEDARLGGMQVGERCEIVGRRKDHDSSGKTTLERSLKGRLAMGKLF